MSAPKNVNSILLTTENDDDLTQAVLFQAARHLSSCGSRVLYIGQQPLTALPPAVFDDPIPAPELMLLMSFVYLESKADLIYNLSNVISLHKPPKAIIVQNMEKYVTSAKDASALAAIMTHATATCGYRLQSPATLITSYRQPVPEVIPRVFFQNMWCVHRDRDDQSVDLTHLRGQGKLYKFSQDDPSALILERVFNMNLENETT